MKDSLWRILFIADNPEDRAEMRRLLLTGSKRRYQFTEAETGAAGLRACLNNVEGPPDCVLLNYDLPDYIAPELLAALGGPETPCCPVMVVTEDSGIDSQAILRLGAQDFISKNGMNPASLTRSIDNAIERFKMVRTLHDRTQRLNLALAASQVGIWDCNLITGALNWDARCKELFGLLPDARASYDIFLAGLHAEDRERIHQAMQRALEPAGSGDYAVEYRTVGWGQDGGAIRWIQAKGRTLFNEQGQAVRSIGTLQDITERKRAERTIRESEEKYRTLFESMAQGVVYHDVDGKITAANPAAQRILGLTLDQMQGRTSVDPLWRTIHEDGTPFPGETHPAMASLRTGLAVSGVMGVFNLQIGQYRWLYVHATPQFQSGANQPFQVYATFDDITDHKRADERLRKSEERFRTLFENSPISIWEQDFSAVRARFDRLRQSGVTHLRAYLEAHPEEVRHLATLVKVIHVNQKSVKVLGAAYKQELTHELPRYFTESSYEVFREEMIVLAEGKTTFECEIPIINAGGKAMFLSLHLVVMPGHEQDLARVLVSFYDITERRETEARLTDYAGRMQQLSRRLLSVQEEERRALARELHDDFGQQLVALKLNLAMLERRLPDPTNQRYLADCIQIVEYAQEHLQNTVRQLRPAILDDLGLAEALLWYVRGQAERTGCQIEVRDRIPPLSPKLETAVFRIVQEAVNNALRHGAARHITITVISGHEELSLAIQDDGDGFNPDSLNPEGQSGLGLISMRERAELLGGRFALASQPGAGVRIQVTIPLLEAV